MAESDPSTIHLDILKDYEKHISGQEEFVISDDKKDQGIRKTNLVNEILRAMDLEQEIPKPKDKERKEIRRDIPKKISFSDLVQRVMGDISGINLDTELEFSLGRCEGSEFVSGLLSPLYFSIILESLKNDKKYNMTVTQDLVEIFVDADPKDQNAPRSDKLRRITDKQGNYKHQQKELIKVILDDKDWGIRLRNSREKDVNPALFNKKFVGTTRSRFRFTFTPKSNGNTGPLYKLELTKVIQTIGKRPPRTIYELEIEALFENANKSDKQAAIKSVLEAMIYELEHVFRIMYSVPDDVENPLPFFISWEERMAVVEFHNTLFSDDIERLNAKFPSFSLFKDYWNKPVNITLNELSKTEINDYYVTLKLEGERRILLFTDIGVYSIFPPNYIVKFSVKAVDILIGMLIDGEMYENNFYSFDTLFYRDRQNKRVTDIRNLAFKNRKGKLAILTNKEINRTIEKNFIGPGNIYDSVKKCLQQGIESKLKHDGLILQFPKHYLNKSTYKWKFPEKMTIDFYLEPIPLSTKKDKTPEELEIDRENREIFNLLVVGTKRDCKERQKSCLVRFGNHRIRIKNGESEGINVSNLVVECMFHKNVENDIPDRFFSKNLGKYDMTNKIKIDDAGNKHLPGKWVPFIIRWNRDAPNGYRVALSVWKDIQNPLDIKTIQGDSFLVMRKYHNRVKSAILKDNLKDVSVVLDLGTGRGGDLGKYVKNATKRIYVVEPDKENLAVLQSRYSGIKEFNEITRIKIDSNGIPQEYMENIAKPELIIVKDKNGGLVGAQDTLDIQNAIKKNRDTIGLIVSFFSLTFFGRSIAEDDAIGEEAKKQNELYANLLNTIDSITEPNVKFVGTVMDGIATWNFMNKHGKEEEGFRVVDNESFKMSLRPDGKMYIHIKDDTSIVKHQEEWLFNFELFTQDMKSLGFTLVHTRMLNNDKLPRDSADFSSINRSFVFQRTKIKEYSFKDLPIDSFRNFRSSFDDNLVYIGVPTDPSNLLHAIFRSCYEKYALEPTREARQDIVIKARRIISGKFLTDRKESVELFNSLNNGTLRLNMSEIDYANDIGSVDKYKLNLDKHLELFINSLGINIFILGPDSEPQEFHFNRKPADMYSLFYSRFQYSIVLLNNGSYVYPIGRKISKTSVETLFRTNTDKLTRNIIKKIYQGAQFQEPEEENPVQLEEVDASEKEITIPKISIRNLGARYNDDLFKKYFQRIFPPSIFGFQSYDEKDSDYVLYYFGTDEKDSAINSLLLLLNGDDKILIDMLYRNRIILFILSETGVDIKGFPLDPSGYNAGIVEIYRQIMNVLSEKYKNIDIQTFGFRVDWENEKVWIFETLRFSYTVGDPYLVDYQYVCNFYRMILDSYNENIRKVILGKILELLRVLDDNAAFLHNKRLFSNDLQRVATFEKRISSKFPRGSEKYTEITKNVRTYLKDLKEMSLDLAARNNKGEILDVKVIQGYDILLNQMNKIKINLAENLPDDEEKERQAQAKSSGKEIKYDTPTAKSLLNSEITKVQEIIYDVIGKLYLLGGFDQIFHIKGEFVKMMEGSSVDLLALIYSDIYSFVNEGFVNWDKTIAYIRRPLDRLIFDLRLRSFYTPCGENFVNPRYAMNNHRSSEVIIDSTAQLYKHLEHISNSDNMSVMVNKFYNDLGLADSANKIERENALYVFTSHVLLDLEYEIVSTFLTNVYGIFNFVVIERIFDLLRNRFVKLNIDPTKSVRLDSLIREEVASKIALENRIAKSLEKFSNIKDDLLNVIFTFNQINIDNIMILLSGPKSFNKLKVETTEIFKQDEELRLQNIKTNKEIEKNIIALEKDRNEKIKGVKEQKKSPKNITDDEIKGITKRTAETISNIELEYKSKIDAQKSKLATFQPKWTTDKMREMYRGLYNQYFDRFVENVNKNIRDEDVSNFVRYVYSFRPEPSRIEGFIKFANASEISTPTKIVKHGEAILVNLPSPKSIDSLIDSIESQLASDLITKRVREDLNVILLGRDYEQLGKNERRNKLKEIINTVYETSEYFGDVFIEKKRYSKRMLEFIELVTTRMEPLRLGEYVEIAKILKNSTSKENLDILIRKLVDKLVISKRFEIFENRASQQDIIELVKHRKFTDSRIKPVIENIRKRLIEQLKITKQISDIKKDSLFTNFVESIYLGEHLDKYDAITKYVKTME